jgi:Fur family ferric uptake transcriptional regulator
MEGIQPAWPPGIKHTRQREQVWSVFLTAPAPLTAMDVYTQAAQAGAPIWLSTIYRILDHFVEKSLLVKSTGWESNMALYQLNRAGHVHYAVCLGCHKMVPMYACVLEEISPQLKEADFQVIGHKLELYGYCKECVPAAIALTPE